MDDVEELAAAANTKDGQLLLHGNLDERDLKIVTDTIHISGLGWITTIQSRVNIATAGEQYAIDLVFLQPRGNACVVSTGVGRLNFHQLALRQGEGHLIGFVDMQLLKPGVIR